MKKYVSVFCALLSLLMLTVPALAADNVTPRYDILDLDGPAAASTAPDSEENTPAPVVDAPVDEATYREETPAPYTPPQRFPGRGEIGDILQYWEENGYPDDVSYAFEAGGEVLEDGTVRARWDIGLVGADEARRQEILALISPNCLVEFTTCLFTHAQKQTAYDTITELAVDDPNILEVIFLRNADTVWVSVPEELTKEYAQYLIRDLGLGAVVSVTDQHSIATFENGLEVGVNTVGTPGTGIDGALVQTTPQATFPATGALVPDSPAAQTSPVFWVCLALAVIAACVLTALALGRRFVPAAVTTHGEIHSPRAPLTRAQVEQAVREAAEAPDSALYRGILEQIQEQSK